MVIQKISKCAAAFLMLGMSCLFADEVPDARDFAEVSRRITHETTRINALTDNFNKGEESQEAIRVSKLESLKNAAKIFRDAQSSYKENQTQENYKLLEEKREQMINIRAELTDMVTDKVNRSIKHISELQQKFIELSDSYSMLDRIASIYKDNLPNKGADISKQIMGSILSSAQTINILLEDDPENQELQTIMDALEGEAKLYEELGDEFSIDVQIKRQAEILKDLTAQLFRVNRSLEGRKNQIKAFAIQSLIGDTLTGINLDVPILPPSIPRVSGDIGKQIDDLIDASGMAKPAKKTTTRVGDRPFLQKLSQRYNEAK